MRISLLVIRYLISSLLHASEHFVMQMEDGVFTWINQQHAHPLLLYPGYESGTLCHAKTEERYGKGNRLRSGQSNMDLSVSYIMDLYRTEMKQHNNPIIRHLVERCLSSLFSDLLRKAHTLRY